MSSAAIVIGNCMVNQSLLLFLVYMDRYGDCFKETYISVKGEEYSILSHGGEAFDTLVCEISFKSEQDDRLCLHFRRFEINKCNVNFEVYSEQSASGAAVVSSLMLSILGEFFQQSVV